MRLPWPPRYGSPEQLAALAGEDLVGLLLQFARETAIDALEVAPWARISLGEATRPLVSIELPKRRIYLSADTARHAALLLSGQNRNGMAMALFEACDQAEETSRAVDSRGREAA